MRDTRPKPRDPFGPPLDAGQLRGFFRRLALLSFDSQQAFVARVNWNLVDAAVEEALMAWLASQLRTDEPERQVFALKTLDKLPHPKRARHTERFAALLTELDEDLKARLAAAFGPVLGGPRKPSRKPGGPVAKSKEPEPVRAASENDLEKLKNFFAR